MGRKRKSRKPDHPHRERVEQHEIDAMGQRLFGACIPPAWVPPRPQVPDYYVDYLVEPVHDGVVSGLQIGVQLRSKKSLRASRGRISYSMKTNQLAYYLKRDEPMFLVLADVTRCKAYYLFLQKCVLEELPRGWRNQGSNAVHVPIENDLSNIDQFLKAAVEARKYMNGARAGSLPAALAAEKRKLESIDPRIEVAIDAGTKGIAYLLNAREPFEFDLILKGDPEKVKAQMRELIERGIPVALNPTDLDPIQA